MHMRILKYFFLFFKYNINMSVELLGYNVDDYSLEEAIIKAKSLIDGDKV